METSAKTAENIDKAFGNMIGGIEFFDIYEF
jgi:hypothetical protein